jgi:signal peptidase II
LKKAFSKVIPFLIGYCIIFTDAESKKYALAHLSSAFAEHFPYGGVAIFENFLKGIDFSLNLVKNKGAAWGLFSQYPNALVYIRVAIILYLIKKLLSSSMGIIRKLALTFICAGALGNLIDHFRFGYVIDMFHFNFWGYDFPVFNVADAFICLGTLFLIFSKGRFKL